MGNGAFTHIPFQPISSYLTKPSPSEVQTAQAVQAPATAIFYDGPVNFEDFQNQLPVVFRNRRKITKTTLDACQKAWKVVQRGDTRGFCEKIDEDRTTQPIQHFVSIFYAVVCKEYPLMTPFFQQGIRVLQEKMISALFILTNPDFIFSQQRETTLELLANKHCMLNVPVCFFGDFCLCLFGCLSNELGSNFSSELSNAWIDVFSDILKEMIPRVQAGYNRNRMLCHQKSLISLA